MPRPKRQKQITGIPGVTFYKPQGVPMRDLKTIEITHEEWEVLRLRHIENLDQTETATAMATSQSTIQRTISSAHQKIGQAIVEGNAIKIIQK